MDSEILAGVLIVLFLAVLSFVWVMTLTILRNRQRPATESEKLLLEVRGYLHGRYEDADPPCYAKLLVVRISELYGDRTSEASEVTEDPA
jgi:hypothetical protein